MEVSEDVNVSYKIESILWNKMTCHLWQRFQGNANGLYLGDHREFIRDQVWETIDLTCWVAIDRIGLLSQEHIFN